MEQVQNPGKGKTNHRRQKGKEKMKVRTERKNKPQKAERKGKKKVRTERKQG